MNQDETKQKRDREEERRKAAAAASEVLRAIEKRNEEYELRDLARKISSPRH
jgi:hypothetical protein